jgi:hypothetical protein
LTPPDLTMGLEGFLHPFHLRRRNPSLESGKEPAAGNPASKREQERVLVRLGWEAQTEDPQVRGGARGGVEPPSPFGHRDLKAVPIRTDPVLTGRLVPVSVGPL